MLVESWIMPRSNDGWLLSEFFGLRFRSGRDFLK
jgi:hypothetical protein